MSVSTIVPELLTLPEAATLLSVGSRTFHRWAAQGRAPRGLKITPGRRGAMRWRRSDIMHWIADGCPDLRAAGTEQ